MSFVFKEHSVKSSMFIIQILTARSDIEFSITMFPLTYKHLLECWR